MLEKGKHLAAGLKIPDPGSACRPLDLQPEDSKDALCSSWPLAQLHLYGQPNAADIKG